MPDYCRCHNAILHLLDLYPRKNERYLIFTLGEVWGHCHILQKMAKRILIAISSTCTITHSSFLFNNISFRPSTCVFYIILPFKYPKVNFTKLCYKDGTLSEYIPVILIGIHYSSRYSKRGNTMIKYTDRLNASF